MPKPPKFFKISDPSSVPALQSSLFGGPSEVDNFPPVVRTGPEIRRFLDAASPDNPIGIDLEFNASRPTIIGLSCGPHTGAVTWDPALCRYAIDLARTRGTRLVAHAAVDADKQEVERALGIETPLDLWECSMTTHYMTNAHFCKAPNKTEDKEETGSLGLMNLWVAASMNTLWPNWKDCRGSVCSGYLCPTHDPIGYCALDSLAGLEVFRGTRARMTALGIPDRAYREHLELNELCRLMTAQGVKIDMRYVRDDLEKEIAARKEELFPEEGRAFNPKSPKQALEYFAGLGITLKSNSKDDVHKALVTEARKRDIELKGVEDPADIADDVVRALWSLFEYKSSGKGLTSWFDDRYLDQRTYEGRKLVSAYVHPRFITVGTATMRLSSARPNFQNVPARGFGELVRKAVVPYEPDHRIIKADFSQLELRKVLHAAGNTRPVARDAFTDLVDRSEGQFERAASLYTPVKYAENSRDACRDIAKSVSHASNYGEGLDLLSHKDLDNPRIKAEEDAGARLIFRDWEAYGYVVSFTGANLAQRLFGDKTRESRKKALMIQQMYFTTMPEIPQWQRRVTTFIQDRGYVQTSWGTVVTLNQDPRDNIKAALAVIGQGEGAIFVHEKMLRLWRDLGLVPMMQVHDEVVYSVPESRVQAVARDIGYILESPSERFPGFANPVKVLVGQTWLEKEMEKVDLS